MKPKQIKLAREQLDGALRRFEPLKQIAPPPKGWIRAIRDALGMTGEQLGRRMGINKQRVSRIERDEKLGKVKLETLSNAADALDCIFVYGFIPRDSLEKSVREQAHTTAKKRMAQSNQLMRLENQELSDSEKSRAVEKLVDEIIETMPKSLWDEI